jgi:hypothetical protein
MVFCCSNKEKPVSAMSLKKSNPILTKIILQQNAKTGSVVCSYSNFGHVVTCFI